MKVRWKSQNPWSEHQPVFRCKVQPPPRALTVSSEEQIGWRKCQPFGIRFSQQAVWWWYEPSRKWKRDVYEEFDCAWIIYSHQRLKVHSKTETQRTKRIIEMSYRTNAACWVFFFSEIEVAVIFLHLTFLTEVRSWTYEGTYSTCISVVNTSKQIGLKDPFLHRILQFSTRYRMMLNSVVKAIHRCKLALLISLK